MKHRMVGLTVAALLSSASAGAAQRDPLVEARQLYNKQQYDAAISAAEVALRQSNLADAAALVLGRARLERFRQSAESADLSAAREALARVRPGQLTPPERIELIVGWGGLLYADGRFGAAAEQFEIALPHILPSAVADGRVLEWWAAALDREGQLVPLAAQGPIYDRILRRMEEELRRDPGSPVATYWLASAARGAGDIQRAWDAATAGWIRASLSGEHAGRLRDDLDRLVRQALIPERARQFTTPRDVQQTLAALEAEWNELKRAWTPAVEQRAP